MADYRDYLRAKRQQVGALVPDPTPKRPGDLVFTGNRVVRVERSAA